MVYETDKEESEHEVKEEPLKENEFICEQCTYKNTIDLTKLMSCYCDICQKKNMKAYDLIYEKMHGAKKVNFCLTCYRNYP